MYIIAKKWLKIIENFHNGSFFIICFLQEPLGILEMLHESISNHLWKCFPISLCCNYTCGLLIQYFFTILLFAIFQFILHFPFSTLSVYLSHSSLNSSDSLNHSLTCLTYFLSITFATSLLVHHFCHINETVFSLLFVF